MELVLIALAIVVFSMLLWINCLAILCIYNDPDLEPFQRWSQGVIVILFPFFGASLVLYLVNGHSPDVVNRFYIPWPFINLVKDKKIRAGGPGHNGEEMPGSHSGSFHDGGSGGGGD